MLPRRTRDVPPWERQGRPWSVTLLKAINADGSLLWPEHNTLAAYRALWQSGSPALFRAVWMQDPSALAGELFHPDWFREFCFADARVRVPRANGRYSTLDARQMLEDGLVQRILETPSACTALQAHDLAISQREMADYYARVNILAARDGDVYVTDVYRAHLTDLQMVADMTAERRPRPKAIGVESVGFQEVVLRAAQREVRHLPFVRVGPTKHDPMESHRYRVGRSPRPSKAARDKVIRARPLADHFERGKVFLLYGAPWNQATRYELMAFPSGAHDDVCFPCDTLVQCPSGPKAISEITQGDLVLGRHGWTRVLAAGCTGQREVISRHGLRATPDHPYWRSGRWVPLSGIQAGDHVLTCSALLRAAIERRRQQGSACAATSDAGVSLTASSRWPTQTIARWTDATRPARWCEDSAASTTTASSVTATLKSSWPPNAVPFRSRSPSSTASSFAATPTPRTRATAATSSPEDSGCSGAWALSIKRFGSTIAGRSPMAGTSTTRTATSSTTGSRTSNVSPLPSTTISTRPIARRSGAARLSRPTSTVSDQRPPSGIVRRLDELGIANTPASSRSVVEPVYNLTTEDGSYYADGVLVHNCDAMAYAFELAGDYAMGKGWADLAKVQEDLRQATSKDLTTILGR